MRQCGILMHISSLPGAGGIGTLGQEAFQFADFLEKAGMKIWQVLPVGPTGYGNSPYQSSSVFAGDPLLISTSRLHDEGLLTAETTLTASGDTVDYEAVRKEKEQLLRACWKESGDKLRSECETFRRGNAWVEEFALFTVLKSKFGDKAWTEWPDEGLRMRRRDALDKARNELKSEIDYQVFVQTLFHRQWVALKRYVNDKGIRIFGDMPIYVAADSADAWTHPEVFQLDKNRRPKRVSGVPPDYFSADGQMWGNPLYRWHWLRFHRYGWWVERMRAMGQMYDMIRIDHFIGFANYYSIPFGAPNARSGKWVVGPGKSLFKVLQKELPDLTIIAEDLGDVNARVRKLLDWCGYPGMRVLTFAFGGDEQNPHLPKNYVTNSVAYTGTHDNDTVRGWADTADEKALAQAKKLLGFEKNEDAAQAFIRGVMGSRADTCIVPMQDVLGLDGKARMNVPGTVGDNWRWRMLQGAATQELAGSLHVLAKQTNRT